MHYFNDEVALSHDVTKSDLILRKKSWERLHKYICQLIPYYGQASLDLRFAQARTPQLNSHVSI